MLLAKRVRGRHLAATAAYIAPLARDEWAKHRDDVLWDPGEAKRRAKEEDEKRNKEALAAKFAHIKTTSGQGGRGAVAGAGRRGRRRPPPVSDRLAIVFAAAVSYGVNNIVRAMEVGDLWTTMSICARLSTMAAAR